MTGFQLSYGGAQEYFGIVPDLKTLGNIIVSGLPVGAYGGRRNIMKMVARQDLCTRLGLFFFFIDKC